MHCTLSVNHKIWHPPKISLQSEICIIVNISEYNSRLYVSLYLKMGVMYDLFSYFQKGSKCSLLCYLLLSWYIPGWRSYMPQMHLLVYITIVVVACIIKQFVVRMSGISGMAPHHILLSYNIDIINVTI